MGCGSSSEDAGNAGESGDPEMQYELDNQKADNYAKSENKKEDGDLFQAAEDESAEQFMAVKPWIGALVAPSDPPQVIQDAPNKGLELEYVNGYRCEDSRQNVFWTNQPNKIVYMTAAIGVVLNIESNQQEFFGAGKLKEVKGHSDDIESLHVDNDRGMCCTGSRGKNPSIFMWDIDTKEVKWSTTQGNDTRAVRLLRFSKCGKFVFTVDLHNDHNIHVFDVNSGAKVASQKTGGDPIFDMDTGKGGYEAVIASKKGCKFVDFKNGNLKIDRGLFASCKMDDQTSVAFFEDGNKCVSGSPSGIITIWMGNKASKQVNGHTGSIHAITIREGLILTSGQSDKTLKVWDENLNKQERQYSLTTYARSIDMLDANIIVGTRFGEIWSFPKEGEAKMVMNGHGTGETWGLAVDSNNNVVTTGDDNKVLFFDTSKNTVTSQGVVSQKAGRRKRLRGGASTLSLLPPNQHSRAVDINPTNGHVALCTNDGQISIRESVQNLDKIVFEKDISNEWCEVVKYSPCGKFIAVGSHDNNIYTYKDDYSQMARLKAHNSFITSLDWSTNSEYIQSNCGAYEYLFFSSQSGDQQTSGASALRDEEWASFTCKLGWPVQGIFPPYTDGSHINGVDRSKTKDVFATGDDWGLINLYRNPNQKGSQANSFRAHSSHVVRVKFSNDDQNLYSVGGYDRTLMKWRVI